MKLVTYTVLVEQSCDNALKTRWGARVMYNQVTAATVVQYQQLVYGAVRQCGVTTAGISSP